VKINKVLNVSTLPVIRIGFEPMTYCLEGSCSIQLSYRTDYFKKMILLFLLPNQRPSRHKVGMLYPTELPDRSAQKLSCDTHSSNQRPSRHSVGMLYPTELPDPF
jgi:hypothetical protein